MQNLDEWVDLRASCMGSQKWQILPLTPAPHFSPHERPTNLADTIICSLHIAEQHKGNKVESDG